MKIVDKIYGEFELPERFAQLVNCPEFIRLKHISQNGYSSIDYPGLKNNNRYEHSIGVFRILSLMINHLEKNLKIHNIQIPNEQKDIALCAMLLHDIGHGPYSHLFEKISGISHEDLTTQIICGNTKINQVLRYNFGNNSPEMVANFIADKNIVKDNNFFKCLKTLISSQLDADRIDYTLRDSYHARETSGIDYKKLIDSLGITVDSDNNYEIYLKDPRQAIKLLTERFQNYSDIYFCKSAIIMETSVFIPLFKKIYLSLAQDPAIISKLDPNFIKLIQSNKIDLNLFLKLTDNTIEDAFKILHNESKDELIKYLTGNTVVDDFKELDIAELETYVLNISKYFAKTGEDSLSTQIKKISIKMYNDKNKNLIKVSQGKRLVDITLVSPLVNPQAQQFERKQLFYNEIIAELEAKKFKQILGDINMGEIKKDNNMEFELKYIINGDFDNNFKSIVSALGALGFKKNLVENNIQHNFDYYYDTENYDMLKNRCGIRIRQMSKKSVITNEKKEQVVATYKIPECNANSVFSARLENESIISEPSFEQLKFFLIENDATEQANQLLSTPVLSIDTTRYNIIMELDGRKIQVSLDNSFFQSHNYSKSASSGMIEIEALGDVSARLDLTNIAEILEKNKNLTISTKSKYQTGFELLYPKLASQLIKK